MVRRPSQGMRSIGIGNTDMETATLSTHPEFLALIERSRARQKAGGISGAEMRRRLGLKRATPRE